MLVHPPLRQQNQLVATCHFHNHPLPAVRAVGEWLEQLGLPQYRQRFLHHCIDGHLLLRLSDAQLKQELLVGEWCWAQGLSVGRRRLRCGIC